MTENLSYYVEEKTTNDSENETDKDLQTLMHAAADSESRDKLLHTKQEESSSVAKEPELDHELKGVKRKFEELEEEDHSKVVANHYNTLEEKGLGERLKSRICHMRNFNNWIKSMLINEYLNKVRDHLRYNSPIRVMDMCCGKGGDLLKWRKANISYLICTDIADVSLEQCETRYKQMSARNCSSYGAEFIAADCSKVRLREKFRDPSIKLQLVSCQFAFHYSFESLSQAECMFQNAADCLEPGGFFIGTIPDANEIMSRRRKSNSRSFGNDIYRIEFPPTLNDDSLPPLFGAKYNFHLEGVVDCPEFLIHFPLFIKLARRFGLKLVRVEKFHSFYERMKNEGHGLLNRMQCFESYPAVEGNKLMGEAPDDYKHAELFLKELNTKEGHVGTLSKAEWEAISLYQIFAFEKVKSTWDSKGKLKYEFA